MLALYNPDMQAQTFAADSTNTAQTDTTADKTIEYESDLLEQIIYDDQTEIRKLIGEVVLWQDDVNMWCDSAYFDLDKNNVQAFGNVIIEQGDSIHIEAEYLQYYGNVREALLYDDVFLTDRKSEITSDTLFYRVGPQQARLYQNVHLTDEKVSVEADSLEYNVGSKQATFFDNCSLTDGEMLLETDSMDYNVNTQIGNYRGGGQLTSGESYMESQNATYFGAENRVAFQDSVYFEDNRYKMQTDFLEYDLVEEIADFNGETVIDNEGDVIYCESGTYNRKIDRITFDTQAEIQSDGRVLKANKLNYSKETGIGIATGEVVWTDTLRNIEITSDYAEYAEKENQILATGDALLRNVMQEDTLWVAADTLRTIKPEIPDSMDQSADSLNTFLAYRNVRFMKSDMQGKCDSMSYSTLDSVFQMYYRPVVWMDDIQLSADSIAVETENNSPTAFYLRQKAFAISQLDTGYYNQVKAKTIDGLFEEQELYRIEARSNVENVYFAQDDNGAYYGVNKAKCSEMDIHIEKRDIEKIVFKQKPEAVFTPIQQVQPQSFLLKGFSWRSPERPRSLADLFVKEERPTETEEEKSKQPATILEASGAGTATSSGKVQTGTKGANKGKAKKKGDQ